MMTLLTFPGQHPIPATLLTQGPYFELWAFAHPDRGDCLLKVVRPDPGSAPMFQAERSVIFSRLWSVHTSASVQERAPAELLERLLQTQARRMTESQGAWNLELVGEGTVAFEGRGSLYGLWMPRYAGESLGTMDRGRQRALFPRMLPALWDALAVAPHLDLSPSNLWIDAARGRFVLLDPAAWVVDYESGAMSRTQVHFVTNAERYPLLGPHLPVLVEQGLGLRGAFEASVRMFKGIQEGAMVPDTLPVPRAGTGVHAADLHALGIMYHEILTGEHPYPDEMAREPAWVGAQGFNDPTEPWGEKLEHGLELASRSAPSARELVADVTPGEDVLARALLELRTGSRSELLAAMAPLARETR